MPDQLGRTITRSGTQHAFTPFVASYWTKDRGYFSVAAGTEKSGRDVLRAMGMEHDERFSSWGKCVENIAAYRAAAAQWMAGHTMAEVTAAFARFDAPGTASMSGSDLMRDPHVLARDMVITVDDAELGPIRMQGVVPKLSATPGHVDHAGLPMGACNDEIYGGLLGLDADERVRLKQAGVI